MQGLTSQQVKQQLEKFGHNSIVTQQRESILIKFIHQFYNLFTVLLVIAAGISFALQDTTDGVLIVMIVLLNAGFGVYQEFKAEESIAALKNMTIVKVRVMRDGKEQQVDSADIVPNDIVVLEEGDKIPADAKLIESKIFEVNESVLTGESLPVSKQVDDELFMGTIVAKGRGIAHITQTGMNTKFGNIASELAGVEEPKTSLEVKLTNISRVIGAIGIIVSAIVFALALYRGQSQFSSLLLAVSLAVAVVPEGLPAVMTMILSIGVKSMAAKKAIIRKLSAIETLGGITLIATDKTGTITANKMIVKETYMSNQLHEEKQTSDHTVPSGNFGDMLINGIVCSTASLVYKHDHGSFETLGDPTEGALLHLAEQYGYNVEKTRNTWKTLDEKPFDSISKRMVVTAKHRNTTMLYTKGATESILPLCSAIVINGKSERITEEHTKRIEKQMDEWAKKGLRVLAFAQKSVSSHAVDLEKPHDCAFVGMVAIHDPPRQEVKTAIHKAHQAGIKVVMITGDNEKTAETIGTSVGLLQKGDMILTGAQVEEYIDEALLEILPKVRIFARTTPFHKARIVKLYQKLGEKVAVTGDGVNDSIALKQGDVGIAMGLVGTDVARETADMVITDDNFATIVSAIEEGRHILKNLRRAITYLLSCNVAESLSLIIGLSIGIDHFLHPIQLLYVNLVTDGVPALALAFSPKSSNIMRQPPQCNTTLIDKNNLPYIFYVGISITFLVLVPYFFFQTRTIIFEQTAAFSILALVQTFVFTDVWLGEQKLGSGKRLFPPIFFVAFSIPLVLQYIMLEIPVLANVFHITTVPLTLYLEYVLISASILLFIYAGRAFKIIPYTR